MAQGTAYQYATEHLTPFERIPSHDDNKYAVVHRQYGAGQGGAAAGRQVLIAPIPMSPSDRRAALDGDARAQGRHYGAAQVEDENRVVNMAMAPRKPEAAPLCDFRRRIDS